MDIAGMEWKEAGIRRGVGLKAAQRLVDMAGRSVGLSGGQRMAGVELQNLMAQHDLIQQQIERLDIQVTELLTQIPAAARMLRIPGVGLSTVAGFLAEVGDLTMFTSWHQLRKITGLNLRENSSGQHKGSTRISKRGRSRLRALLYRAVFQMVAVNADFKLLHQHFKHRVDDPLKPKQSLVFNNRKFPHLITKFLQPTRPPNCIHIHHREYWRSGDYQQSP